LRIHIVSTRDGKPGFLFRRRTRFTPVAARNIRPPSRRVAFNDRRCATDPALVISFASATPPVAAALSRLRRQNTTVRGECHDDEFLSVAARPSDAQAPARRPNIVFILADGKWHLGALPLFSPLKSGYNHFYGFRTGALDYYLHTNNAGAPDFWDEDKPFSLEGYSTDLFGDRAVKVIGDYVRAGQSFFLSLLPLGWRSSPVVTKHACRWAWRSQLQATASAGSVCRRSTRHWLRCCGR
jgi:hypothetical protein